MPRPLRKRGRGVHDVDQPVAHRLGTLHELVQRQCRDATGQAEQREDVIGESLHPRVGCDSFECLVEQDPDGVDEVGAEIGTVDLDVRRRAAAEVDPGKPRGEPRVAADVNRDIGTDATYRQRCVVEGDFDPEANRTLSAGRDRPQLARDIDKRQPDARRHVHAVGKVTVHRSGRADDVALDGEVQVPDLIVGQQRVPARPRRVGRPQAVQHAQQRRPLHRVREHLPGALDRVVEPAGVEPSVRACHAEGGQQVRRAATDSDVHAHGVVTASDTVTGSSEREPTVGSGCLIVAVTA